jgi:hypothetical protein
MELKKYYYVDDIQRIHEIDVKETKNTKSGISDQSPVAPDSPDSPKTYEIASGDNKGKQISQDFLYTNQQDAHEEISDRHSRLHKAFKNINLIACLSINKEPSRKMEGLNRLELEKAAQKDEEDYKGWIKNLKKSYQEINNEKPDLEKLSKTLKNANLVKKALENPLAIDFIEIMAKEAQINKGKALKNPQSSIER